MGKYYSVKCSSSDEVIDMTEIEDTLEHKYDYLTSHTQHEGYYSPNLAEKKDLVFDNARLHTENAKNGQPPMLSLDFKGRNGGGYHFSIKLSKKLSESLNNCKNVINNAFEYGGAIRRPRDSYTLSDIELEKAASAVYNNAIKYWGSISHSAFNDQLASNDDTIQHSIIEVTMNYIGSGDWLDENKNYGKYDVHYGFAVGTHMYSLWLYPNKNRKNGFVSFQNSKKERITPGFISDAVRKQAKSECNLTDSECNLIGRQVSKKIRSYTGQHEGYYSPNLNDAKPFRDRYKQMAHSAFNDQLASNDDKAKYYKYMSGKYDPKTKNVTLKFSNGLYNVQVVCQGSMYGRVNSLPEMKEYVQNAFYAEVGAHKYLDSSNASKAAVYLWDAKNSHFGKANPLNRLQHSAIQSGKARPYVFDRVVKSADGRQLGVRFTGGGDRNWIEVYFPWLAPTDDERYYINYLRNEFSGKLRERPEATRTVPGEIEKAAKAVVAYYSNPPKVRRRGSGLGTGPVGPGYMPNVSHSFSVVSAYDEDYLEHHGILGMKWGVRRYQNANGTLTAEGRERYGIKTKSTGGNSEYSTGIDKLKSKYEKNLTDATMQRRSAIHYQSKPNGEKASKFTRASMAGALDKADRYEKKAEKIKNKAEKKYGAKFEINDRDYKEVYDEVMKYYERKTTSEIGKERAAWFGKNLILGGALGGALWSTLDLAEGKNIHSKYKIKE